MTSMFRFSNSAACSSASRSCSSSPNLLPFSSFLDMTQWDKDQWGAQQEGYPPFYANGGEPNPGYSQPYAQSSVGQPKYNPQPSETQNSPFEGGRFQPKKRINDIFFLIFFILQVSTCCFVVHCSNAAIVRRVCCAFRDCPLELHLRQRVGGWFGQ